MTSPRWNQHAIAQNYELGRPMPPEVVLKMWKQVKLLTETKSPPISTKLLDAGCGTGRIAFPLAQNFPELQITGIDASEEMLAVFHAKIQKSRLTNVALQKDNLLQLGSQANTCDYSLVSSVLHGMSDWKSALRELCRVTKSQGYLLLISEKGDVYDFGLGRKYEPNGDLLAKFWAYYIDTRKQLGISSPEASQVGLPWRLGLPQATIFLAETKLGDTIATKSLHFRVPFTIRDLLHILEYRPWSSLFCVNDHLYQRLLAKMEEWIADEKVSPDMICESRHMLRCEIIKVR